MLISVLHWVTYVPYLCCFDPFKIFLWAWVCFLCPSPLSTCKNLLTLYWEKGWKGNNTYGNCSYIRIFWKAWLEFFPSTQGHGVTCSWVLCFFIFLSSVNISPSPIHKSEFPRHRMTLGFVHFFSYHCTREARSQSLLIFIGSYENFGKATFLLPHFQFCDI